MSENEDVTRCVCGFQDYPGAPIEPINGSEEDPHSYIQCDECKAWQHIGCLSFSSGYLPADYFCEDCRPDIHIVLENSKGLVYHISYMAGNNWLSWLL